MDGRFVQTLIWIAIALFLLSFANWATRSGIRVREEAWRYSSSLRYQHDIGNAMHWGDQVLQNARQEIDPSSAADPTRSAPNLGQILRGEGRVYDALINGSGGDYQLDYPPLRLLTMAYWMRHVEQRYPNQTDWPGAWHPGAQASEEIAAPLLDLNTLFSWLSCIFSFFLVWLWVYRGGRRGVEPRVSLMGPRRPLLRRPTSLIDSAGLLLFPLLACIFYYALLVAVSPTPEPPPTVTFAGAPIVSRIADSVSANVRATINSQGAPTQWSVDWGTLPGEYSHSVRGDDVPDSGVPTDVSVTLPNLPANTAVHYRITARNDAPDRDPARGITRTGEGVILTAGDAPQQQQPPSETYGAVWLSLWQWLGVGALFAALCGSVRLMPVEHRGWACGLLAAMLMWLNPAILVDAHVWPQWDVWVLPPFLLAALLASLEWWFTAGLIFGIGTMFKGQFLIGAPVLLLWPLLSMRWGAFTRMFFGVVLSTALIVSPWIVLGNQPFSWSLPAVKWIARVGVAAVVAALIPLMRKPLKEAIRSFRAPQEEIPLLRLGLLAGTFTALLIVITSLIFAGWPADAQVSRSIGLWLFLGVLIPPWLLRRRWLGLFAACIVGIAMWMSAWLYLGSWSWETIGFEYGMSKFDKIAMARGSNGNLASILAQHFGWQLHDPALTLSLPNLSGFLPARFAGAWGLDGNPFPLDLRQTLIAIFAACLVACAVGAGMNDRRNHPRFLAALVAPWMLMPNILGQMMTRYQMWGAALSALLVGVSGSFGLVNALFSLLAAGMIGNQLLQEAPGRSPQLHQLLGTLAPDDGWIMLCMAGLVLFVAVIPGQMEETSLLPPPIQEAAAESVETSVEELDEPLDFVLPDDLVVTSEVRAEEIT